MVDTGRVISTAIQFTDGFTKPSKAVIDSMKKMAREIKSSAKDIQNAGKTISSVGTTISTAITVPIVGIATAAVTTAADFESAMTEVKVVAGSTAEEFELLKTEAKRLGATTKFSAIESAEAMQYMAQAGWDTSAILAGTEGVMNAAASSGEDLATVADILAKNITAFGDSASDAGTYADVLAAAAAVSAADVSYLGESFTYCASTAGSMGYSVQDVSVALAAMSQGGIEAGTAGASLRNIIANMAKPTKSQLAVMEELGLSLTDSAGKTKDFATIMNEMRAAFSGLSESEKAAAASGLAGKESMAALLTLVNTSDADWATFSDAINNATGTAATMAEEMQNNLSGQITLLKSGIEGIAITIGDKLLPYVKTAVSWVQTATDYVNSLNDAQIESIIKIAAVAASIGPAIVIFGKMVTAVGSVTKTVATTIKIFAKFGGALGVITSPAAIVIGVLAAIAIAAALIIKNWDQVKAFLQSVGGWFKDVFTSAGFTVQGFRDKFSSIGNTIGSIAERISNGIKSIAGIFKNEFAGNVTEGVSETNNILRVLTAGAIGAFDTIVTAVDKGLQAFDALLEFFGGAFAGNWDSAAQGFRKSLQNIFPSDMAATLTKVFDNTLPAIQAVVSGIKAVFTGLIADTKNIFDGFTTIFGGIGTILKGIFSGDVQTALDGFKTAAGGVLDVISGKFKMKLNIIKNLVVGTLSTFLPEETINQIAGAFDQITGAWDSAMSTAKRIVNDFTQSIKPVLESIKTIFDGVGQFLKGVFTGNWQGALDGLKTIASGALSALVNTVKAPFSAIAGTVNDAIEAFKSLNIVENILSTMGGTVKKVLSACGVDMTKFSSNINNIKTRVGSIINNLRTIFSTVFGAISKTVRAVATVMANVFGKKVSSTCSTAKAVITAFKAAAGAAFSAISSAVQKAMNIIVPVVKVAFSTIKGGISAAVNNITAIISGLLTTLDGITTFIAGVFTGNWSKAWQGVKTIFKGVFESLAALCKAPINAVIGIINGAISGINKLGITIPDWVPVLGGQSFSINVPTIPMLYKGTNNWNGGAAVVNDRGGEIIDLPQGSRVYPHDQSVEMARQDGAKSASGSVSITIQKLADKIEVRSDEDIDKIAEALAYKLKNVALNTGTA